MPSRNLLTVANNNLRSVVKNLCMGAQIKPLFHKLNSADQKIAFTNCNIFDGITSFLKEDMTILIEDNKIIDVDHREKISIPTSFYTVNAAGKTIMPGMIDNHAHICSPFTYDLNIPAIRQMRKQITLNNMRTVFSGVTTVCDMGGPWGLIKEFQKQIDSNAIPGPRYSNCYTLLSPVYKHKLGYPSQVKLFNPINKWLLEGQVASRPRSVNELKRLCYKIKDEGGTHIKTSYQPHPFSAKKFQNQNDFPIFDDVLMKAIFSLGKETGLTVSVHSPYGSGTEKCVNLAIEVGANIRIQHMIFDIELNETLISKMRDHEYYITPTIMIYGDVHKMTEFVSWLNENPENHLTPEANRQLKTRIQKTIDQEALSAREVLELDNVYLRDHFDIVRRNTQKAHDAGIIGIGTDCGGTYTGFFGRISSEILHYSEFGIPPFATLKYLTSVNAKINGLDDRGVIQAGKLADIIMVNGNPLMDIGMLNDVCTVMKDGVFLKFDGDECASL